MAALLKYSVGCDNGKKSISACFSTIDYDQKVKIKATRTFDNSPAGIKEFMKWVEKNRKEKDIPLMIGMEATGNYYENLAMTLYQNEYQVTVILPSRAKQFLRSTGLKSKNDIIDAKGIARMVAERNMPLWEPMEEYYYQLRALTRRNTALQKQKTILISQRHAHLSGHYKSSTVGKQHEKLLNMYEKQIKEIEKAISLLITENPDLQNKFAKLTSIKGVGLISAATTIAETGGFRLFENQRQLISYAGYDVIEDQSGSRKGKTKISKKGNTHIRRVLFMPAFNVVKWNIGPFVQLYDRVFERTNQKMKAYVAVQKKILTMLYTLWKKDQEFDPEYYHKQLSGEEEFMALFPLPEGHKSTERV